MTMESTRRSTSLHRDDSTRPLDGESNGESKKKPSILARVNAKVGLNLQILLLMVKGAIGPTVGLALYQINGVAKHFSTIGYLIPIMSVLTVPVAPRAKFIQNFLVTSFLIGIATGISILAMWISVQARANTTPQVAAATANGPVPGARVSPFNAAASANMGFWLFFEVWLANMFRAFRPQYFLPSIVFSIFCQVTGTYGTQFAAMSEVTALIKRLLETFFVGFGLSLAVNFLFLPVTCRRTTTLLMTQELNAVKRTLDAQTTFEQSLPTRNWFTIRADPQQSCTNGIKMEGDFQDHAPPWPEADALKRTIMHTAEGYTKVKAELRWAKYEFGWANLGPKELAKLTQLMENILAPILGMEALLESIRHVDRRRCWETFGAPDTTHNATDAEWNALEEKEKYQWQWMYEKLHSSVQELHEAMRESVNHAMDALKLTKPPRSWKSDIESNTHQTSGHLEAMIEQFLEKQRESLKEWCVWKGMNDPSHVQSLRSAMDSTEHQLHKRHQFQLYHLLNFQYWYIAMARSILNLVNYADAKLDDGTMKRSRFVYPSGKQLKKWFWAAIFREDCNVDYPSYSRRCGTVDVHLDDVLQTEKDPEHLPLETMWDKVTDKFRIIPHFFGSSESLFGFRVAVATMCIALVAYLRNSQHFFIQQRFIWGSIMVAVSMTQTAGSGLYGQFMRVTGTIIAMALAYIDWYIVDGQTPGVIVFVGLTMFLYHYALLRFQHDPVIPIIGMVTVLLIVGYALQVKKVGRLLSESNGQQYHALYVLAPYRLATVLVGVGVAFFFNYFPNAVTVRSRLRRDLGSLLYLLAHYYSSVYTTASLRLRDLAGDPCDEGSPGRILKKARTLIYTKQLVLLENIKQHLAFFAWEPRFGGRYPREKYEKLIELARNVLLYSAMLVHATDTFQNTHSNRGNSVGSESWFRDLKELIISLDMASHGVTSILTTISSAIALGKPLPLDLKVPEPPSLTTLLTDMDTNILSVEHILEPGYSALAVLEVTLRILHQDLAQMLDETKKLVGELDFQRDLVKTKVI